MQMQRGVLIVAADAKARLKVRGALQEAGYSVVGEADNSTVALALAETEHPGAAIIDAGCRPAIDAMEIARALAIQHGCYIVMAPGKAIDDVEAITEALRVAIGIPWARSNLPELRGTTD